MGKVLLGTKLLCTRCTFRLFLLSPSMTQVYGEEERSVDLIAELNPRFVKLSLDLLGQKKWSVEGMYSLLPWAHGCYLP